VTLEGAGRVLGGFRDPVLVGLLPLLYGAFVFAVGVVAMDAVGYDFRGTIWEPATALVDGRSPYPEATRQAIELGNPAVYPPFVFVLAFPLGLLGFSVAMGVWTVLLAAALVFSLRVLEVRDWRCYALAVTSAPVLEGFYWGNITLALLPPLAIAWRWRDRPRVAGIAIGVLVAAKLFAWPLVVWLLLTRRFRAALWSAGAAVALVGGAWVLIGFDGLTSYPALLSALEDVYGTRSFSVATAVSALGAPSTAAVMLGLAGGIVLIGLAGWLARRADGGETAFAVTVAACIVATPVVWPYYFALLYVPIAIRWPRLAPAWFFGQLVFVVEFLPAFSLPDPEPCCRPDDVPPWVWAISHTDPEPWRVLGLMALMAAVAAALVVRRPLAGSLPAAIATARGAR
jgi:hypothetical protein